MILSYIQDIDIDNAFPKTMERPVSVITHSHHLKLEDIPRHNIDKVKPIEMQIVPPAENETISLKEQPIDNQPAQSFESKYALFKEKIERDRLAWESLAKRIT